MIFFKFLTQKNLAKRVGNRLLMKTACKTKQNTYVWIAGVGVKICFFRKMVQRSSEKEKGVKSTFDC